MLILVGKMPGFGPDIEKRSYNMTFLFKSVNTNFRLIAYLGYYLLMMHPTQPEVNVAGLVLSLIWPAEINYGFGFI